MQGMSMLVLSFFCLVSWTTNNFSAVIMNSIPRESNLFLAVNFRAMPKWPLDTLSLGILVHVTTKFVNTDLTKFGSGQCWRLFKATSRKLGYFKATSRKLGSTKSDSHKKSDAFMNLTLLKSPIPLRSVTPSRYLTPLRILRPL